MINCFAPPVNNYFNTQFTQALQYHNLGWSVIPIPHKSKKAKLKWKPYQTSAPTKSELQFWFKHTTNSNFAVITGKVSNIFILDLDDFKYKIPFDTTQADSNRGSHLYFSIAHLSELEFQEYAKWIKSLFAGEQIDVKDKGYVMLPPSIHPESQKPYQWSFKKSPFDTKPTKLSPKLIEIFCDINNIQFCNPPPKENYYKSSNTYTHHTSSWEVKKKREDIEKIIDLEIQGEKSVFSDYKSVNRDSKAVLKIMHKMGIHVECIGKAFLCPLHSDNNPSASLFQPEDGYISMRDFHSNNEQENFWDIGELYYHFVTGKVEKLEKGMLAVWYIRCLLEFGFIEKPVIKYNEIINPMCLEYTKKLYEHFILLLQCRFIFNSQQKQVTPFTWRFASDWCNLTEWKTKEALDWLIKYKYLKKTTDSTYKKGKVVFSLVKKKGKIDEF